MENKDIQYQKEIFEELFKTSIPHLTSLNIEDEKTIGLKIVNVTPNEKTENLPNTYEILDYLSGFSADEIISDLSQAFLEANPDLINQQDDVEDAQFTEVTEEDRAEQIKREVMEEAGDSNGKG